MPMTEAGNKPGEDGLPIPACSEPVGPRYISPRRKVVPGGPGTTVTGFGYGVGAGARGTAWGAPLSPEPAQPPKDGRRK